MEELKQDQQPEAVAGIFDDICPFDGEQMEQVTIEFGIVMWQCTVCGYMEPV